MQTAHQVLSTISILDAFYLILYLLPLCPTTAKSLQKPEDISFIYTEFSTAAQFQRQLSEVQTNLQIKLILATACQQQNKTNRLAIR